MQIKLNDGIKIGDEVIYDLSLRRLTTADLMDAELESERPTYTPAGFQILSSPAIMGYALIRRCVLKVGHYDMSLTMEQLRGLSESDFSVLNKAYEALNSAAKGVGMGQEGR